MKVHNTLLGAAWAALMWLPFFTQASPARAIYLGNLIKLNPKAMAALSAAYGMVPDVYNRGFEPVPAFPTSRTAPPPLPRTVLSEQIPLEPERPMYAQNPTAGRQKVRQQSDGLDIGLD